jgi:hypothetical protein
MTAGYLFEGKVLGFAQNLSAMLAGEGYHTFLMVLTNQGAARTLQFEASDGYWQELMEKLDQGGDSYLFYDPFEGPEYTYLSWC